MTQVTEPTRTEYLRARAAVAVGEVRAGRLDGELALALAVWPPPEVRERERRVARGTIAARAYGPFWNQ